MLEFQMGQERAKEIAQKYRNECSYLKTMLIEKDVEMQVKLDATHSQDQMCHFWCDNIIKGQSHSDKILRSSLRISAMNN